MSRLALLLRGHLARVVLGLVLALLLVKVGAWALPGGPGAGFDHGKTKFPLTGPHAKVACESCHPAAGDSRQWTGVPTDCHGCHGDRTNHRGTLGPACEKCHTATTWTALRYDAGSHRLPLTGSHDRPCVACHTGGAHLAQQVGCHDCHAKVHGGTSAECSACHATTTWTAVTYQHKFPPERLPGPHQTAPCLGCHGGFQFQGTSFSCRSCHLKDLKHDDLGECSQCHDAFSWTRKSSMRFDHDAPAVGFALTGAHGGVACGECHKDKSFGIAPRACEGCHTTTPHADLGPCAPCHTTASFKKPGFSHDATRFPLDARHARVGCAECHTRVPPGSFTPGPGACETCHRDPHGGQFWSARDAGFASRACSECHTTNAFVPSTVDVARHAGFAFALQGAHQKVPCAGCHERAPPDNRQIFVATKTGCVDCHGDHHKGLLGTDCASCHGQESWKAATGFDHGARTGFALQGVHATVACDRCHVDGAKLTPPDHRPVDCATCHRSKHGAAFGKDCVGCHDFQSFADATRSFDHTATMFPLERRHRSVPCASCHAPGVARPPDPNCRSCHGDPHLGRTLLDCGQCHRPDNWLLVRYDHDLAEFPLKGKHFFTPCKDCHTNDVWSGLRRECVSCHRGDAQQANMRVSGHAAYTWDCIECHRPWSWGALVGPAGSLAHH